VQVAHLLMNRCRSAEAKPLQAIGERVRTSRGRRKIATVALARHIPRIAYYILRDGTAYPADHVSRLKQAVEKGGQVVVGWCATPWRIPPRSNGAG
jgi:hypothetical protein